MTNDADELMQLRLLDDFLDGEDVEPDLDDLQAEIAQAQLAVKKANLRAIRAKLDAGADARVVPIDRARLRAQLRQAMSGDADLRLTLAARGNDDHDIDDLIDDLAELDNETGDRPA